jgi:hypothetical protein
MGLQKPYDVQALVEQLKTDGLTVAEQGVKSLVTDVFQWVSDSVKLSATPFDDIILIVLPKIQEQIMKELDKIDGKVSA